MADQIVAPSHYVFETKVGTFQVRHITEAFLNRAIKAIGPNDYVTPWALHCIVESITYLLRSPFKGSFRSDVRKAIHYLEIAVDTVTDAEYEDANKEKGPYVRTFVAQAPSPAFDTLLDVFRKERQAWDNPEREEQPASFEEYARVTGRGGHPSLYAGENVRSSGI